MKMKDELIQWLIEKIEFWSEKEKKGNPVYEEYWRGQIFAYEEMLNKIKDVGDDQS